MSKLTSLLAALLAAAPLLPTTRAADAPARDLWVYTPTNLAVDKNVDDLEALLRRAAKDGTTASCWPTRSSTVSARWTRTISRTSTA